MVTETFNLSTLRALDIFSPLSDDELELLRPSIQVRVASVGDVLMEEGSEGDEMFVILLGECKVIKGHRTLDETVIATLGPLEVCGVMALLTGEPRSASVMATDTCRLLTVTRVGLHTMLMDHPKICIELLTQAHRRVARLTRQLAEARGTNRITGVYPVIPE